MRTIPPRARFAPALALRRRPRLRRALVVLAAVVLALVVQRTVATADAVRAAWGPRRPVVVAARDLPAGHVVGPGDLRVVELPPAAVPDGAFDHLAEGRVVRSPVLAGEVLLQRRVSEPGVAGVAALLPEGTRAIAVPVEPGTAPPLEVGQRVDVVGVVAIDAGPQAGLIAAGALVVAVGEGAATLAVAPELVPRVAAAVAGGAVSLAVVAP